MYLHNQTAMQFLITNKYLIARVKYKINQGIEIIPNETYRQDLSEEIKLENQTLLKIHGLNEETIRAVQLEHNQIQYKAHNAQNFWRFLKDQWGMNKQPPQTSAQFILPILNTNDSIKTNLMHDIQFEPLPWTVKSKSEFRETTIEPELHQVELNHTQKTLSVILAYPINSVSSISVSEGC
jgi:hypothetical protein